MEIIHDLHLAYGLIAVDGQLHQVGTVVGFIEISQALLDVALLQRAQVAAPKLIQCRIRVSPLTKYPIIIL